MLNGLSRDSQVLHRVRERLIGERTALMLIVALLLFALFLSGVAAIINQTVWQRALKVYLAGSEAMSSMIVVLVFMFGLGAGSFYMARSAHRVRNPMRLLAVVEMLLFAINLFIAFLLSLDISESVHAFQRAAVSVGVPLRLLYALVSTGLLLGPTFLMGITMPLISEVAQRQLDLKESRFLTILFFLNTLGAVAGGLVSGFYLMPYLGQFKSLFFAAGFNALAGLIILTLYRTRFQMTVDVRRSLPIGLFSKRLQAEEIVGFFLGFLALGYEMYLFRIAILAYKPLPYTFSTVLCFYLLMWSIGVFLARWVKADFSLILVLTALAVVFVPDLYHYGIWGGNIILFSAIYTLPCIGFGLLFGQLVSRVAVHWGNDVGRFYGLNTIGSCFGILATVLIGYEFYHVFVAWAIAFGYLALLVYWRCRRSAESTPRSAEPTPVWVRRSVLVLSGIALGLLVGHSPVFLREQWRWIRKSTTDMQNMQYFSREGVVEVHDGKEMRWDGLWHSQISANIDDHIGENNWLQAVVPLLCQRGGGKKDALVIGVATGITAATLAKSEEVNAVDGYEINPKLKLLLEDYPQGTLQVATNPKVNIIWQDARTGLALNDKQYDLITQAPLYLMQAGSSILLSKQYMEIVKKRLKPGGTFAIYSNALGNLAQALVVRKTAAQVFKYYESFGSGYLLVVSDAPIEFSLESIQKKLDKMPEDDPIKKEVLKYGVEKLSNWKDSPRLNWENSPVIVTDDHPIVEYPDVANKLVTEYQLSTVP
jgi:spermidine synthase